MNLLFIIFRQHYININDEEIKIQLIKNIFQNEFLIKRSYVFLVDTMKALKPKMNINKSKDEESFLIDQFLNLKGNKELNVYQNLLFFQFNKIN